MGELHKIKWNRATYKLIPTYSIYNCLGALYKNPLNHKLHDANMNMDDKLIFIAFF